MPQIVYEFAADGAPQTSAGVRSVKDQLDALNSSGTRAEAQLGRLNASANAFKVDAVAKQVEKLVSTFSRGHPELQKFASAISAISSGAGAGAMFGPWGAAIGGVTAAIISLNEQLDAEKERRQAVARAMETQRGNLDLLVQSMEAEDRMLRLQSGQGSVTEQAEAAAQAQQRLRAEHARLREESARLVDARARLARVEALQADASNRTAQEMRDLGRLHREVSREVERSEATIRAYRVSLDTAQQTAIQLASGLRTAEGAARDLREEMAHQVEVERQAQQAAQRAAEARRRRDAAAAEARALAARQLQQMIDLQRAIAANDQLSAIRALNAEWERQAEVLQAGAQISQALAVADQAHAQARAAATRAARNNSNEELARLRERSSAYQQFYAGLEISDASRRTAVQRHLEDIGLDYQAAEQARRELEATGTAFTEQQLVTRTNLIREHLAIQAGLMREQEDEAKAQLDALMDSVGGSVEALAGQLATGMIGALKAIRQGTMSAGEAFQSLLASFLEMLASMAALEAIKNYAAAIGAAASQNYASAALHLAAGAAWTVVAVAAGAGAVAAAPAVQTEEPASPQGSGDGGGGGGGTTIVYFNSPMVVAGTRQELGREIEGLIDESRVLEGRAA